MVDKDQQRRERAYNIWEDEGRPDGVHEDHWRRAGDESDLSEQESEDVTKVNQEADDEFAGRVDKPANATDIRPPSTVSPD